MPAAPPTPSGLVAVMGGGLADWATGAGQAIFTAPTGINGMTVSAIYGRSPSGVQPVTLQLVIGGVTWGGAITLVQLIGKSLYVLPMPSGLTPMLAAGDSIVVVPSLAAAGKMTFDVPGYLF